MAIFGKKDEEAKADTATNAEAKAPKKSAAKKDQVKNTSDAYRVLIRPIMTEKINKQSAGAGNVVAFKVAAKANKITVANAVSALYNVTVEKVRMVSMPAKPKNFGRSSGYTQAWKKAVVTLKKGQVIQE